MGIPAPSPGGLEASEGYFLLSHEGVDVRFCVGDSLRFTTGDGARSISGDSLRFVVIPLAAFFVAALRIIILIIWLKLGFQINHVPVFLHFFICFPPWKLKRSFRSRRTFWRHYLYCSPCATPEF